MRFLTALLSLLLLSGPLCADPPPPFSPNNLPGLQHWILPHRDALSSSESDPNVLVTPDDGAVIEWLLAGQQVARTITGILEEVPPHGGQIWPPDVDGDTVFYGTYEAGVAPGGLDAVRFASTTPFTRYYWQFYYDLSAHTFLHNGTGCFVAFLFYPTSSAAYQEILATADGANDTDVGLSIAYNGTDERMEIRVARGASGFAFSGNTGNGSVPLDTWTVVGFRLKPTAPRVSAWVSTTQVISSGFANAPSASDHSTFLQISSAEHRFEGDLGELLVYNTAPGNPDALDAIRYLER